MLEQEWYGGEPTLTRAVACINGASQLELWPFVLYYARCALFSMTRTSLNDGIDVINHTASSSSSFDVAGRATDVHYDCFIRQCCHTMQACWVKAVKVSK